MSAANSSAGSTGSSIVLERINRTMARIPIEGTTPLMTNKFSAKAQQLMLDRQMKKPVTRGAKDPEQCFRDACHRLPDDDGKPVYGFPGVGFKAAIVDAARFFKGSKLPMTDLRRMIFVNGRPGTEATNQTLLVPIYGEWHGDIAKLEYAKPQMRQDYARNETGVADIRFRPQFTPWSAVLEVIYVKPSLTLQAVVALVDAAGLSGIGEWRPASKESNTGSLGMFRVPVELDDIKEVTM